MLQENQPGPVSVRNVVITLLIALFFGEAALPRPVGALGAETLNWNSKQISSVIAGGSFLHYPSRVAIVDGRKCLVGNMLNLDVRDDYAFDIDETVELSVDFHLPPVPLKVSVNYDQNGVAYGMKGNADLAMSKTAVLPAAPTSNPWHTERFILDRARFANGGFSKTDILIQAESKRRPMVPSKVNAFEPAQMTVCGISLKRSGTTPIASAYGQVTIAVVDEVGRSTPVRLGLYDKTGRLPLPSDGAIAVQLFGDVSSVVPLVSWSSSWPVRNRSVFYVNGHYEARLPVGEYELIATKGPEYYFERQRFTIAANKSSAVTVKMRRWENMVGKGWYSGDDHVHYPRISPRDNDNLLHLAEAEDLHVINALQHGNSGAFYTSMYCDNGKYCWDVVTGGEKGQFAVIPGQEDPRTGRRGHTLHLGLKSPVRDPERYLLYHETFEQTRRQGAVVGYAHLDDQNATHQERRGLALDMPWGLVDFVEVLQFGKANTKTWFDLLNLGYRLTPAAGSDFPALGAALGAERTYVRIDKTFTPQEWLEGFKRGRTFVSNGPMLEFRVNSSPIGSELQVKSGTRLIIEARAALNPSLGQLDRLELIEQGEAIQVVSSKEGSAELRLRHEISAEHGTWLVVRGQGKPREGLPDTVAFTAPIYVYVDGDPFWKRSVVPEIVSNLKKQLRAVLSPPSEQFQVETWDARDLDVSYWMSQEPALRRRAEEASARYESLAERARGMRPRNELKTSSGTRGRK